MSKENVGIVRGARDAFNRADFDAVSTYVTSDFEVDMTRAVGLDAGIYDIDQWRRLAENFGKAWESVRYEFDEVIDAGDRVVTPFTNTLVGRDGVEVKARGTWVWTIRQGAVSRLCLYQGRREALEAAGLME